jgi:PQQ-dependent dehydrogenase (s-GDH family)
MKNFYIIFLSSILLLNLSLIAQSTGPGSRLNEIFQVQELSVPNNNPALNTRFYDPWEVTYGPDDSLWITEAKNYKVYKISSKVGARRKILDISKGSTFLPAVQQPFDLQFNFSAQGNPQGGLAGLAIHPQFLSGSPYVFISYIWKYIQTLPKNGGVIFKNSLVRFTYNFTNGLLENPLMVCDTLPGSSDHNSQRIIIAPVNGVNYLFYANGDMGAGQFGNSKRTENAQNLNSYEGKILRFNIDPLSTGSAYDQWIPNDNPFNGGSKSAIWGLGIRNNQGFAYANINNTEFLYGSSHGPFSDDEINIIKKSGNYGHPLVIGYAADGNYNAAAAGVSTTYGGSLPVIVSESANAAGMANYQDPIYCFYPAAQGNTSTPSTDPTNTMQRMYWDFNHGNQSNAAWPSEAPSGLDIYTKSMIPGWKNSLILAVLKGAPNTGGGKLLRVRLNTNGDGIITSAGHTTDTISYFGSTNRYRDLAFSPDGLSIFAIIDSSSKTSGPTGTNPINSLCKGCLLKFTFLGYADNGTTSTMPDTINIAGGTTNSCITANSVNIGPTYNNSNIWVPITDTNSNIIAEINANGNDLGTVNTSYYINSGSVREVSASKQLYLDRNMTITPTKQPLSPVNIKFYISNTEFVALKNATNSLSQPSGVSTISNLGVFKNNDACGNPLTNSTAKFTASSFTRTTGAGANGYALQTSIPSFSTFYFAKSSVLLAISLVSFSGDLYGKNALLQWVVNNESAIKNYILERSIDGINFKAITTVNVKNLPGLVNYSYQDIDVANLIANKIYYRLKSVGIDGKLDYSNIVIVLLNSNPTTIFESPNPVTSVATIKINSSVSENCTYQILDNAGRAVLQKDITVLKGETTFSINMNNLAAGSYYLSVKGYTINQKIKIEKL